METSAAGADVLPAYTHEPGTLKKFLQHLDKCGKAQYNLICHKLVRDSIGQVTEISPEGIACLPLPTTTPSKKKYNLDNIAGYINIDAIKKSKRLHIVHTVVCPEHIHSYRVQNIKRHTYTHTSTHAFLEVLCQTIDHMQRTCQQHVTLHIYTYMHTYTPMQCMYSQPHMYTQSFTCMHTLIDTIIQI